MTIHVLLSGELHRDPVSRTSQAGRVFTTANLKVQSDGETTWCSVICFDSTACEEMLRLRAGDACSISGKAKLTTFERNGEHRASLDVVASNVIALKPKPRERKPRQPRTDSRQFDAREAYARTGPAHEAEPDFDDPVLF